MTGFVSLAQPWGAGALGWASGTGHGSESWLLTEGVGGGAVITEEKTEAGTVP